MAGVKVASKVKFSVYLREKAVAILFSLGRGEERKTSASIAKAIRTHQGISSISPATVAASKQYLKQLSSCQEAEGNRQELPGKRNYQERVQTYLSNDEANYLEAFGRKHTNGNYSLAINRIIEEVAAIAVVSPEMFAEYFETIK